MDPLVGVLLIFVAAGAFVAISFWLERRLRQPGLGFILGATALLVGSVLGFVSGNRLLPTLFAIQAIGLLYSARWRRSVARASRVGAVLVLTLLGCSDSDIDHTLLIEIPASVAEIPAGTLHVSLYRYDPFLMDSPATRVDHALVAFSHRAGQRTVASARLEGRGVSGERFYLGVDGCISTADGARSILWDGLEVDMPTYVRLRTREGPLPPCQEVAGE